MSHKTKTQAAFESAVDHADQAIAKVRPAWTVGKLVRAGYYEEAVFMLWVAVRTVLYDEEIPAKRREIADNFIRKHLLLGDPERATFTRQEVESIVYDYTEHLAQRLSSLRQGTISIRGRLFEQVIVYPLSLSVAGKHTKSGKSITVNTRANKYGMDAMLCLHEEPILGLSIKGNIRERIGESVDRAKNARMSGALSDVWHVFTTSGDAGDRAKLREIAGEPEYRDERIYTWTPLVQMTLDAEPNPFPVYRGLSSLPRDVVDYLDQL